MASRVVRVRKADPSVVAAVAELIADCRRVDIRVYKPRLSRTVEVEIKGPSEEAVERAYADLARFASRLGLRIE